ncbi:MAG: polyphosphate polymerase domain-containing protein [Lachnospiraceae bacterium]|nr:polyphosphate polymerase domain-containing protein [Lachnospiraceae bacterium]
MIQTVFNRYERKFLMTDSVYQALRLRLAPYMQVDDYGLTTISNIYYDTPDRHFLNRSIEKPAYKEKLRLRSYGVPDMDSTVFLEIKKKYKGIVNKRRIALPLREAYDYIEKGDRPNLPDCQILREFDYFLSRWPMEKGVYVAYDRIALFGKEDPSFRVTFDTNIRSRKKGMALENGDMGELLLPEGWHLMESKILGATPLWFSHILSELEIRPVSFSKVGNILLKDRGMLYLPSLPGSENEKRSRRIGA